MVNEDENCYRFRYIFELVVEKGEGGKYRIFKCKGDLILVFFE